MQDRGGVSFQASRSVVRNLGNTKYVNIGTHRTSEGVDCFGRTGRSPVWPRPLLYVLCALAYALRFKGCEMYHARAKIEEQRPPATGGVNNFRSTVTVCGAYLTKDPAVRTGRDFSSDSASLSIRSSGTGSLACSKSLSQSLSSDPLPVSRHSPFRYSFTTAERQLRNPESMKPCHSRPSMYGNFSPATMLEICKGRKTFVVPECLVQYFLSKKAPLRIDLINAILTRLQFVQGSYNPRGG